MLSLLTKFQLCQLVKKSPCHHIPDLTLSLLHYILVINVIKYDIFLCLSAAGTSEFVSDPTWLESLKTMEIKQLVSVEWDEFKTITDGQFSDIFFAYLSILFVVVFMVRQFVLAT